MARNKVYFDTRFWESPAVQEDFSAMDKLFFVYLATNSRSKGKSVYRISKSKMAFDLSISSEGLEKMLEYFEEDLNIISYDSEDQLMTFDDTLYFLFRK